MNQTPFAKYTCPLCIVPLEKLAAHQGVIWTCPSCRGHAVGLSLLQKLSRPDLVAEAWRRAKKNNCAEGKSCPSCRKATLTVTTSRELGSIEIDVCGTCQFIWFDQHELEKIPRASKAELEKRAALASPAAALISPTVQHSEDDSFGILDAVDALDIVELLISWLS